MAVVQQPTKFGFTMKYQLSGATKKTKSVDYINLTVNPTTEQASADDAKVFFIASEINRGILGDGSTLESVYRTSEAQLIES